MKASPIQIFAEAVAATELRMTIDRIPVLHQWGGKVGELVRAARAAETHDEAMAFANRAVALYDALGFMYGR